MLINGRNVCPCPTYEPYSEYGCVDAPEWMPAGSMLCWYPEETYGEYPGGFIKSLAREDSSIWWE